MRKKLLVYIASNPSEWMSGWVDGWVDEWMRRK